MNSFILFIPRDLKYRKLFMQNEVRRTRTQQSSSTTKEYIEKNSNLLLNIICAVTCNQNLSPE